MSNTHIKARSSIPHVVFRVFHIFLLFLTVGLILDASFKSPIGIYDEGFALTNALRLLNNEIPHLHYWSAYPPGTAIVLAFAFDLFEPTLLVARCINVGWALILITATYAIISRLQSVTVSTIASLSIAWWYATAINPSYSGTSALALSMVVGSLLVFASERKNENLIITAALIGGVVILFRHDFAFYLLCASAVALIVDLYCLGSVAANSNERKWRYLPAIKFLSIFGVISLSLLLTLIYFSNYENVLDQMILFPAIGMREHRLLPVPGFFQLFHESKSAWLLAWSAPIALVIGGILSIFTRSWKSSPQRRALLFSGVMSLLLILQSRNRFDLAHAAPSIMFVIIFICAACKHPEENINNRWVRLCSYGLMVSFMAYSFLYLWNLSNSTSGLSCALPFRNTQCMSNHPDQKNISDFIKSKTNADDYVFVGNTQHDEIFVNDASLYFLMQRRIPVRWNEMHPGVVTTRKVQEEIIKALEVNNVRYAVLVQIGLSNEPNMSAKSSEVFVLDEYLKNNYRQVFSSGKYVVNERIGNPASK